MLQTTPDTKVAEPDPTWIVSFGGLWVAQNGT